MIEYRDRLLGIEVPTGDNRPRCDLCGQIAPCLQIEDRTYYVCESCLTNAFARSAVHAHKKQGGKVVRCTQEYDGFSLIKGREYICFPGDPAERDGYLCVVDETREDYLFPSSYFEPVED